MNNQETTDDDEVNFSEEYPPEQLLEEEHEFEIIETKGRIEGAIKSAQQVMDETFKDEESKCIELKLFVEKYERWFLEKNAYPFVPKKSYCFYFKQPEINNTLDDFFFLLMSGKYTSSLALLRKFLELVIFAIYFDTIQKNTKVDKERERWLAGENIGSVEFMSKLKEVCIDKTDFKDIKKIYRHLSSYVHNVGAKKSFALFYDKDKLEEVYSNATKIDEILTNLLTRHYT